jgi:hypothetical protein
MIGIQTYAVVVALGTGWATVKIARKTIFDGVGVEDGGGWAALLMIAVGVTLAAAGLALPVLERIPDGRFG